MTYVINEPAPDCDVKESRSPERRSLKTFHPFFDAIVTYMTGKALPGQKPLIELPPIAEFALSQIVLGICILAGIRLVDMMPDNNPASWAIWFLGYYYLGILIVGRLRYLSTGAAHYATHNCFAKSDRANTWIASLCLAITLGNPDEYFQGHIPHHQKKIFTTLRDPDAAFLYEYGFRPGMSEAELWQHLVLTMISPVYHAKVFWSRVGSMMRSRPSHKVLIAIWLTILAWACSVMGWLTFILIIGLPLSVLFQMSVLLQLLTEHTWKPSGESALDDMEYASRSAGRFCAVKFPEVKDSVIGTVLARLGWLASMVLVQIPVRMGVLVSDLTVHDLHHLTGQLGIDHNDWVLSRFLREEAIQAGDIYKLSTRENWGLKAMLSWQFKNYANSEPL